MPFCFLNLLPTVNDSLFAHYSTTSLSHTHILTLPCPLPQFFEVLSNMGQKRERVGVGSGFILGSRNYLGNWNRTLFCFVLYDSSFSQTVETPERERKRERESILHPPLTFISPLRPSILMMMPFNGSCRNKKSLPRSQNL